MTAPIGSETKIGLMFDGLKYSDVTPYPPGPLFTPPFAFATDLGGSWIAENIDVFDGYVKTAEPPLPPTPPGAWPDAGVGIAGAEPPGVLTVIEPPLRITCVSPGLSPGDPGFPVVVDEVDGPPAPPAPPNCGINWVPEGMGP